MKSHLISQTLLKRFSHRGYIRVYDKYSRESFFRTPDQIAFQEVTLTPEIKRLEKKWSYVESRMATAFQSLDNASLLSSPKHIESVKKFMGLHYLRSMTLFAWLEKNEKQYFDQAIADSITAQPDKKDEILRNKEQFRSVWFASLKNQIPDIIKKNQQKIEDYIMQYDLEIGFVEKGANLVLGDIPLVNKGKSGDLGVAAGVDITQSIGFVLPLGPKHIAALINKRTSDTYRPLSNREVININNKSIAISYRFYYDIPRAHEYLPGN